jgi:N-acetylglucosamine kinase-like BadF-type ATPase
MPLLALDIGGTKLAAGLFTAEGELLASSACPTNPQALPADIIAALLDQAHEATRAIGLRLEDASRVGLSFGGVPSVLSVPFAAITDFVDPAVDFSLKFQANGAGEGHEEHEEPENDSPVVEQAEDGSNVVSVDFTRKK